MKHRTHRKRRTATEEPSWNGQQETYLWGGRLKSVLLTQNLLFSMQNKKKDAVLMNYAFIHSRQGKVKALNFWTTVVS